MPKFDIGQIIHHRKYDYRGVVVGRDAECRAPASWWRANRTKPDREQPWYHVLVDGGHETYVAEENLEPDASGDPVAHPKLTRIFAARANGRYHRFSPN